MVSVFCRKGFQYGNERKPRRLTRAACESGSAEPQEHPFGRLLVRRFPLDRLDIRRQVDAGRYSRAACEGWPAEPQEQLTLAAVEAGAGGSSSLPRLHRIVPGGPMSPGSPGPAISPVCGRAAMPCCPFAADDAAGSPGNEPDSAPTVRHGRSTHGRTRPAAISDAPRGCARSFPACS
jgi:hypothetical protein